MSTARDIVAGIGFRHAVAPEAIAGLVRRGLAAADLSADRLRALATAADRAAEPAFQAAAAAFGCDVLGLPPKALRAVDALVPTRSGRILAERGIGSLSEAAALAGAGEGAVLVLARIAEGGVTCALASTSKAL